MQSPHVQRIFSTQNSYRAINQVEKVSRTDTPTELPPYARKFFCSQKKDLDKIQSLLAACESSMRILESNLKNKFFNDVDLHFRLLPTLMENEEGQRLVFPMFYYNETVFETRCMKRSLKKCKIKLNKIKTFISYDEINNYERSIGKIDQRFQDFLSGSKNFREKKKSELDTFFLVY